MKEITAMNGVRVMVDDEDFESINAYQWRVSVFGYAVRSIKGSGSRKVMMHRQILGLATGDGKVVDHINGNKLDNRRANLRLCTQKENNRNVGIRKNNTSGYKGVSFQRHAKRFAAQITVGHTTKKLGYFSSAELAHEFYCLAADLLHGEYANHGTKR